MTSQARWKIVAIVAAAMLTSASLTPAEADGRSSSPAAASSTGANSRTTDPTKRDELLGKGWQQSGDRLWTTSGDANGFHLLVADAKTGYTWRTAATLSQPGIEADQWIGNACVTQSGRRAVVVYAPRTFTNQGPLFDRGGFTAVVDLDNGLVTPLSVQSTLAYYNPGCGLGETVALTQSGAEDLGKTGLLTVDATNGKVSPRLELTGQITSAVPVDGGYVGAGSTGLLKIDNTGGRSLLSQSSSVPAQIKLDAQGGVVFMEVDGKSAHVRRTASTRPNGQQHPDAPTLASGPLGGIGVTASASTGKVYLTGHPKVTGALPSDMAVLTTPASAVVSTRGEAAIGAVVATTDHDSPDTPPVHIEAKSLRTGKDVSFVITPDATRTTQPNSATMAAPHTNAAPELAPIDDGRVCAVPRNDPATQVYQPKPKQVEWAADMAVKGKLTITRSANWKSNGLPAYVPQQMFPPVALKNAPEGSAVPAQILLGILGQESNLWQAARYVMPGQTGNPLIGNYYGINYYDADQSNDWAIDWSKADCGYGISQMTDGMRLSGHEKPGETAKPANQQKAIATDYAANIAAGLQLLATKWNELQDHNIHVNNNDPSKLENWFLAIWAYNSGYHNPGEADANGAFGLGWGNNPANPNYDANRRPFGEDPHDFAHPQDWPYPEKVLGFAANPPGGFEGPGQPVPLFRPAWWNGTDGPESQPGTANANRAAVKPPTMLFCTNQDNCEPGTKHTPTAPGVNNDPAHDTGPCAHQNTANQYDLKCWWHGSVSWKSDCDYSCGNEFIRYDYPDYKDEQPDGTSYRPDCGSAGLPAGALVIDDVDSSTPSVSDPNCGRLPNSGSFDFAYGTDSHGVQISKIDLHQMGAGYGAHLWFSHTNGMDALGSALTLTGNWTLNHEIDGPAKILVHIPDTGAEVHTAQYRVDTVSGAKVRELAQDGGKNRWAPLGTFMFHNVPAVHLTNQSATGDGSHDIAFDAVAVVPIKGTYHEESVEADAVFDENQNIDTSAPESWLAGPLANRQSLHDWAMDSTNKILGMTPCQPEMVGDCIMPQTQQVINAWRNQVNAAGTDTINHPAGNSLARWVGFANSYQDRPASDQRPSSFDDDSRYKIKLKATISFVTGDDGKVISGSESADYEHRTANTHIPKFLLDVVQAIQDDYGIARPDLRYRMPDLNHHDGEWTSVDPYANGGFFPGRAYVTAGRAPVPVDSSGAPSTTNAVCVAALTNAGGSIGYRPMLSQSGPVDAVANWVDKLSKDPRVAKSVSSLASDIRGLFFATGLPGPWGSLFQVAPPIWQELNFKACADGSIQRIANIQVLRSSWMPDQYLYHNNKAINLDGSFSGNNKPVATGDFTAFSRTGLVTDETSYNGCDTSTGRSGNPWGIAPMDSAGVDPAGAHFCLDSRITPDAGYSS
jgi:hypothetical protein